MNTRITFRLLTGALFLLLISSTAFAQTGDNTFDATVNLGLIEGATLTGNAPEDDKRGILTDILFDPVTGNFATASTYNEYGLGYNDAAGGMTPADPLFWQVEWPTAKNINYITVAGPYKNQPQPHTGWAIQIDSAGSWKNIVKTDAGAGWRADTLKGIGGWVENQILEWKGFNPVTTTKLRFAAYANPDSLADDEETFGDSLWSFVFVGKGGVSPTKAVLIQYLDHSAVTEATNDTSATVNLGLLGEAVVSASFMYNDPAVGGGQRGEPAYILFDPVRKDFRQMGQQWGEFGYSYNYTVGMVTEEEPFYWMVEWATPKNVNYFTWGGTYTNQPQINTLWKVQAWDGTAWETLVDGVGTEDGIGVDSTTNSVWLSETPVATTKFRIIAWSDGVNPLWSFHIRGRGGLTTQWDERDTLLAGADTPDDDTDDIMSNNFKSSLLQYVNPATVKPWLESLAIDDDDAAAIPAKFALDQNYPNPFNPTTKIGFSLDRRSHVRLTVLNLLGQEVAELVNGSMPSGHQQVVFDAMAISSGVYFYRLELDHGAQKMTRKMLLLK